MKTIVATFLALSLAIGPLLFATVNARNGVTVSTSSTINGQTPNSDVNGQTLASGGGGPTLVLEVNFNEPSGTTCAAVVGPNGTTSGGRTPNAAGYAGTYNGSTSQFFNTDSSVTFGSVITVSGWIKSSTWAGASGTKYLINGDSLGNWSIAIDPSVNTPYVNIKGTAGTALRQTFPALATDVEIFIVAVIDNSTTSGAIKFYKDTVLQTAVSTDQNDKNASGTIPAEVVGCGYNTLGQIDSIRVHNGELDSTAIAALYAAGPQ